MPQSTTLPHAPVYNWITVKVALLFTFQLKVALGEIHENFNTVIVFHDIIHRPVFV
jgi:hypothetical protein